MGQQYIGVGRLGSTSSVAYTGTAGSVAALPTGVHKVRVHVTTDAFIKIDTAAVAATTDMYLSANAPEYFIITPGQKVSAVQSGAGGTLFVTQIV